MPKPLGMTATLKTVMPSGWMDQLWDAIQEAQAANVTVDQFKKEVMQSWIDARKQYTKYEESQLRRWK